jgi:hypothetical protein
VEKINVEEAFSVAFKGRDNVNTYCPYHEDPNTSTSKSASVSLEGLFKCHGCNVEGDAFDFYSRTHNLTRNQAIIQLTKKKTKPKTDKRKLEPEMVDICMDMLKDRPDFLRFLHEERGLTDETLAKFSIGCDERRITIPIFDNEHKLVNIRRYLPHAKSTPKMVSFASGYGKPRMFPIRILHGLPLGDYVVLCEGEWDTLLLAQYSIPSVCITSGVTTWDSSFTAALADRNVVVIYDVHDKDDLGQRVAWARARQLRAAGAEVKVVNLPLPPSYRGGDITDYIVKEHHTAQDLLDLIEETSVFDIPAADNGSYEQAKDSVVYPVTLNNATLAEYYYKKISFKCIVAGKASAPYLPPRHVNVEIMDKDGSSTTVEHIFDPFDGAILSLINCSEQKLKRFIKALLGVQKGTIAKVNIIDTFNIMEIFLIPAIGREEAGPYVMRRCYYTGHGLQANRTYAFEGYTLPHPITQSATHILTKAEPAETDIDTFQLEPEDERQLATTFQTTEPLERFESIATQLSEHVTKIYGRSDLHMAVDLVFHSPTSFYFDGSFVHKGWLEAIILGDTRTGKGFVTEGLCRHYGVGEVVSGENITLAGLVGGVQRVGDRWTLVWGKIPLADKRLIIMDESGALSQQDISRLSRIRSEGVAEITKIISEKTTSRTRLIWLANPRPLGDTIKKLVVEYNYGIEAVAELVGAAEDIARFDFALVIAHGDVPADIINREHEPSGTLKYTSELCNKLIMWVWSRKPEQIKFEEDTTHLIMTMANSLASQFTPKIPLVQGEDVRFKLARIAVAAAGRTFSTADGENLLVKQCHVVFAYNFLHQVYSNKTTGYEQFSTAEKERSTLRDPDGILEILRQAEELLPDLVDGLLEHTHITIKDMCDYAGLDIYFSRSLISKLVRCRALIRQHGWYIKKPAFKEFLRKLKTELVPDQHTMEEADEPT